MFIVFIRTVILYIVVLFALRLMGKSELSKMSTFQMVIMFMLAELASIPIDSPDSSLLNGVVAIFTLLFLQILCSYISIKSERLKNFINGRPSILINRGKINVSEMRRLRITLNDLFEQLRIDDCPSPSDVEYAVMESNGEMSVIPCSNKDLLPLIIINDGTVYQSNLKCSGISESVFYKELHSKGFDSAESVFLAFLDMNKKLHIYPMPDADEKYSEEVK